MRLTMRKFLFVLPACAILLAGAVLTSELGSSLSAQTPVVTEDSDDYIYDSDDGDISATSWIETAGKKNLDTRKPNLPAPKAKGKAAKAAKAKNGKKK